MDAYWFTIVRLLMSASLLGIDFFWFFPYLGTTLLCICFGENTNIKELCGFSHKYKLSSDNHVLALLLCALSIFHIELFYISVPVFS